MFYLLLFKAVGWSWTYKINTSRYFTALFHLRRGLSSSSISKMKSGDEKVFQTMSSGEFKKLTPNLIADVGVRIVICVINKLR